MNKTDAKILKRGLKHIGLSLFTTALFALAVAGFVTVAFITGYLAVLLFIVSIVVAVLAISLLYAQGLTGLVSKESTGEEK